MTDHRALLEAVATIIQMTGPVEAIPEHVAVKLAHYDKRIEAMHRRSQKAESEALRWKDACLARAGAPHPPSITGEIAAARLARSKALRDTIPSPPPVVPFLYEVQLPSAGGWAVRYLARTQDEAWEHAQPGDRVMRK